MDCETVLAPQAVAHRPEPEIIGYEDVAAAEMVRLDVPPIEVAWTSARSVPNAQRSHPPMLHGSHRHKCPAVSPRPGR